MSGAAVFGGSISVATPVQTENGIVFADLDWSGAARRLVEGPLTHLVPWEKPWEPEPSQNFSDGYDHDNITDDHTLWVRVAAGHGSTGSEISYVLRAAIAGENKKGAWIERVYLTSALAGSPPLGVKIKVVHDGVWSPGSTRSLIRIDGRLNTPNSVDQSEVVALSSGIMVQIDAVAQDSDGHRATAQVQFIW